MISKRSVWGRSRRKASSRSEMGGSPANTRSGLIRLCSWEQLEHRNSSLLCIMSIIGLGSRQLAHTAEPAVDARYATVSAIIKTFQCPR
eukprot:scaffold306995_cov33-Tisochrysis_lutea.AAC.2